MVLIVNVYGVHLIQRKMYKVFFLLFHNTPAHLIYNLSESTAVIILIPSNPLAVRNNACLDHIYIHHITCKNIPIYVYISSIYAY